MSNRIARLQRLLTDENDAATQLRSERDSVWEEVGRLRALVESKGFCADCGCSLDEPHCAPARLPSPNAHAYAYADDPDDECGFCQLCDKPKAIHKVRSD